MADFGDIIRLLSDDPEAITDGAPSPVKQFLHELFAFIETSDEEPEPGKPSYLRASSLYRLCPRREALSAVFPEEMPTVVGAITAGQQMTFDLGHAVHAWFQNKYLGPMGKLWGHWFCLKCDRIVHTGLMPKKCKDCGRGRSLWHAHEHEGVTERFNLDNFVYVERSLVDHELGLTAHPDGLLYSEELRDVQTLFELKTISSDGRDKVLKANEAKPEHIIQIHAYMHLTGLRETYVVYFDKGKQCEWVFDSTTGISPGEERLLVYHVEFDDDLWDGIVQDIKAYWRASELHAVAPVSADAAPFKRKCKSPMEQMARDCPMRDRCFALREVK